MSTECGNAASYQFVNPIAAATVGTLTVSNGCASREQADVGIGHACHIILT